MKILFLDDTPSRYYTFRQRTFGHFVLWCKTAKQAIEALEETRFDVVMLDHDLEDKHYTEWSDSAEGTGRQVANWAIDHLERVKDTTFIIHSLNPVGGEVMKSALLRAGLYVLHAPGCWTQIQFGGAEECTTT